MTSSLYETICDYCALGLEVDFCMLDDKKFDNDELFVYEEIATVKCLSHLSTINDYLIFHTYESFIEIYAKYYRREKLKNKDWKQHQQRQMDPNTKSFLIFRILEWRKRTIKRLQESHATMNPFSH
jgi:hypothetical protein